MSGTRARAIALGGVLGMVSAAAAGQPPTDCAGAAKDFAIEAPLCGLAGDPLRGVGARYSVAQIRLRF